MCAVKASDAEQQHDRAVAHIEAAGIGAEGRHDQALAVAGETAPADRAAALGDPRDRMQMAGDLAFAGARRQARDGMSAEPNAKVVGKTPADAVGRIGIVIAGDPDPIAPALKFA